MAHGRSRRRKVAPNYRRPAYITMRIFPTGPESSSQIFSASLPVVARQPRPVLISGPGTGISLTDGRLARSTVLFHRRLVGRAIPQLFAGVLSAEPAGARQSSGAVDPPAQQASDCDHIRRLGG